MKFITHFSDCKFLLLLPLASGVTLFSLFHFFRVLLCTNVRLWCELYAATGFQVFFFCKCLHPTHSHSHDESARVATSSWPNCCIYRLMLNIRFGVSGTQWRRDDVNHEGWESRRISSVGKNVDLVPTGSQPVKMDGNCEAEEAYGANGWRRMDVEPAKCVFE